MSLVHLNCISLGVHRNTPVLSRTYAISAMCLFLWSAYHKYRKIICKYTDFMKF